MAFSGNLLGSFGLSSKRPRSELLRASETLTKSTNSLKQENNDEFMDSVESIELPTIVPQK